MNDVVIERFGADALSFDTRNPRLVEFFDTIREEDIINVLWSNMAVNELVLSILANGFFTNEAMYAVREGDRLVIVEGNRRLAAVKAIINPELIRNGGMNKFMPQISEKILEQLNTSLPVIVLDNRQDAWRLIGFKHVNGAAKWDSYAKAEYIAQVHNEYCIPLEDIATQIGDSNKTTMKLYQGLMLLNQADRETEFKKADVFSKRIYFSHVYTAMTYSSMQSYLGINLNDVSERPVSDENLKKLEEVMIWILGSKKQNVPPVFVSQNPGIRQLCQVIQNPEALQYLRTSRDLDVAFDLSQNGNDVFYEALVSARVHLQKALSKLSYYDGDEDMLKSSLELANDAESLFNSMKERRNKKLGVYCKRSID